MFSSLTEIMRKVVEDEFYENDIRIIRANKQKDSSQSFSNQNGFKIKGVEESRVSAVSFGKSPEKSLETIDYEDWNANEDDDEPTDFVLVYTKDEKNAFYEDANNIREIFEENLEATGLILRRETEVEDLNKKNKEDGLLHVVKVYVPTDVLWQYAEILKLRFPIKHTHIPTYKQYKRPSNKCLNKISKIINARQDSSIFPVREHTLKAEFNQDKDYLFDKDSPDFFNEAIRIGIAAYILERESFGNDDQDKGIRRLISEGVYKAAYPLHDGFIEGMNVDINSMRYKLFKNWAPVSKWKKYQPLNEIKDYFGPKFALYFAWMGFYTIMLVPASVVGILCFISGLIFLKWDNLSNSICHSNIIMCPRCDRICDYWKLSEGCLYAKIQHFIDNPSTIFFAVFMSLWSVLFIEFWKRYRAEIIYQWGLTGLELEAEPPRAEYLMRSAKIKNKTIQKNPITDLDEPVVSFWGVKLPNIIISYTVAMLCVTFAIIIIFGVLVYRMALMRSGTLYKQTALYKISVVPATAAMINFFCIVILSFFYRHLAKRITEREFHRTQTEYEDSLSLKIFLFECANYYSSMFYIAFIKGNFVGYPGKYNRIFGFRQEECDPGGCLMELTVQVAVFMIGKQFVHSLKEMFLPFLAKMYKSTKLKFRKQISPSLSKRKQWIEDYKLKETAAKLLLEYVEMIIQYGFVTLFVTAFPLAPLFALIHNIFELRIDAKKFLVYYRRPVPQRIATIGIWFKIIKIIGQISVLTNALIIAFSSYIIPQIVLSAVGKSKNASDFLEHSLAYFDIRDFDKEAIPERSSYNISVCRYLNFRNPPNATGRSVKYHRSLLYWHILTARLAFIVVYQNFVNFVGKIIAWIVPDAPQKLTYQIKREAYQTKKIIIKNETEKTWWRRKSKFLS